MKLRYSNEKTQRLIGRQQARSDYELDLTARAYKDARNGKIEIVHSFLEFASHYIAEATGIPTVYTVHDPVPDKKYLDYTRLLRFPEDHYVAISQFQAHMLRKLVTVAGVVYNGLDETHYVANTDPGEYLLFVGRYMPEKGVEDAVKAGRATKTLTILAGSKEYRKLPYFQNVIAPYIKPGQLQDVGFMKPHQKNGLFGGAKALLFPIHWDEPFGMVMIEAMACGTPVIAYNRGSVSEIVRDGVTGFVVDPKKGVAGLVEAIKRVGEIDRAACRKHVEENFSIAKMVGGYENVYKQVLAK